jgi:eukaryotic-like serine/threonine-protein kinase
MAASMLAGRYRLQDTLSATAMAEVRLAVDTDLDRQVVVKILAPDANRARFEREARAVAALAHPNIVRLFDFGEDGGRPFMVFEHLPGGSLEDRLSQRPDLGDADVARVAADVAAGLAHAHQRGVVHRDLKPANILFDSEDRAKLADLGIASLRGADPLTDAGTVLGTAAYISPEQTYGDVATPASDVYSYGVVLYRLLSARLPFESDSAAELVAMHRELAPPPLDPPRPGTERLAALAMASLAKSPEARPADGDALLEALSAPARGDASVAETQVLRARSRRTAPLAAAILLIALAVAGVLAAALLTHGPEEAPATPSQGSTVSHAARTSTSEPRPTTAQSTSLSTSSTTESTTSHATTTTRSTRQETTAPTTTEAPTTAAETTLPETTIP